MRRAMTQADLPWHADAVEKLGLEAREIQCLRRWYAVKVQVEQRGARKLHGREALIKGARRKQPVQQLLRHRRSTLVVAGVAAQCLRRRHPMLENLRWELDKIPADGSTGLRAVADPAQQTVQSVTEFVKQGHCVIETQ